jgi:cellulose biosynthesis protein BcsQ
MNEWDTGLESIESEARGHILTFYSYKGGTGRSMALANVAWMLALNNKRVLVIDWDLEAPGLHRYFHPFLEDVELQSTRGLLDFVEDLAARSATSEESLPDSAADISSYVISLDREGWDWEAFGERAGIDLFPAGQQDAGYSTKLNSFNWIAFYEKLGGRRFLAHMRLQIKRVYDYILIDSRTGVSDTSGICTVEMPDSVVVCFTLNIQSIRGAARICESIVVERNSRDGLIRNKDSLKRSPPELRIYPIPTRVELSEFNRRQNALAVVQRTFSRYLGSLNQSEVRKYWGSTQMAYVPNYAFEEIPAVFGDTPDDHLSLCAFIMRLTTLLTSEKNISLENLQENVRIQVANLYQRPSELEQDLSQLAEVAFEQMDATMRAEAIRVLLRLVQISPQGFTSQVINAFDLEPGLSRATRELINHRILCATDTLSGQTLQLCDMSLIEKWPSYGEWIQNDLAFLTWRQTVATAARSWLLGNRQKSDLLRGQSLNDAKSYLSRRHSELNDSEQNFIGISTQRDEAERDEDRARASSFDLLRAQVGQLEEQLSTTKAKTTSDKPRFGWSKVSILLLVVLTPLLATILYAFILQRRAMVAEKAALVQAQADAEKQRDMVNEQEVQMKNALERAEVMATELSASRKKATTTDNSNTKPAPIPANPSFAANGPNSPPSTSSNAAINNANAGSTSQEPITCHVAPPGSRWPAQTKVRLAVDGRFVGYLSADDPGKGLDFPCQQGLNDFQMTVEGTPYGCKEEIEIGAFTTTLAPSFELQDGKLVSCHLSPIISKK